MDTGLTPRLKSLLLAMLAFYFVPKGALSVGETQIQPDKIRAQYKPHDKLRIRLMWIRLRR